MATLKCPHCGAEIEVMNKQKLKLVEPPKTESNPVTTITKKQPSNRVKKIIPAIVKPRKKAT